ncbi:hypothetical protein KP509_18G020800 [Ceratopteris richardii]|uniref:Malectin-like domain-containing protein n=1 Tax=Ceratopteris richardii TaxID=49495 RepID=A0A8T2SSH5_CERRI|nr:hypothetical protein KP509_18G020800 [Ceratopteris richardii]
MASVSFSALFLSVILQTALLCSIGSSQTTGFTSIDCGSDSVSNYIDENGIQWLSDSNLMSEGTSVVLSDTNISRVVSTMRLFNGSQSKYCYNLSNSAVRTDDFLLVRATIFPGVNPPYSPRNPDGYFRFTMIIDADQWWDVKVRSGDDTRLTYDAYVRAKRSHIDVCFARITPNGDAPFISALELRPLPNTLTSTTIMNLTDRFLVCLEHANVGVPQSGPSYVRFPDDTLDRYWTSYKAPDSNLSSTQETIKMSTDSEKLPEKILQNSLTGSPGLTLSWTELEADVAHYVQFYFSEVDPFVNASGMRLFNIFQSGELVTFDGPVDVFATVGANAAFSCPTIVTSNAAGAMEFTFTPLANSTFPAFLAAFDLFQLRGSNSLTPTSISE